MFKNFYLAVQIFQALKEVAEVAQEQEFKNVADDFMDVLEARFPEYESIQAIIRNARVRFDIPDNTGGDED